MTLPFSGAGITIQQINVELGRASGAAFSFNGATERGLAHKPSGAVSLADFSGQTNGGLCTLTDSDQANTTNNFYQRTLAIGGACPIRDVVLAVQWGSDVNAVDTVISSGAIGGAPIAILSQSAANGSAVFTNYGCAIVSARVPSGTTGLVRLNFSNSYLHTVYVDAYRVTGGVFYDRVAMFSENLFAPSSFSALGVLSLPAGGLLIGSGIARSGLDPDPPNILGLAWTGATERSDTAGAVHDRRGSAMSFPVAAVASHTVGISGTSPQTSRATACAVSWSMD